METKRRSPCAPQATHRLSLYAKEVRDLLTRAMCLMHSNFPPNRLEMASRPMMSTQLSETETPGSRPFYVLFRLGLAELPKGKQPSPVYRMENSNL